MKKLQESSYSDSFLTHVEAQFSLQFAYNINNLGRSTRDKEACHHVTFSLHRLTIQLVRKTFYKMTTMPKRGDKKKITHRSTRGICNLEHFIEHVSNCQWLCLEQRALSRFTGLRGACQLYKENTRDFSRVRMRLYRGPRVFCGLGAIVIFFCLMLG